MRKPIVEIVLLVATVIATPAEIFGQGFKGPNVNVPMDARMRRAMRDRAVARAGQNSREFVETYGEVAAAAILRCSPNVGRMLTKAYEDGNIAMLADAPRVLQLIAHPQAGDDVAMFILNHIGELCDPVGMNAFMSSPLEYAMRLKKLEDDVAENRKRPFAFGPISVNNSLLDTVGPWALGGSVLGFAYLLYQRVMGKKERATRRSADDGAEDDESWKE